MEDFKKQDPELDDKLKLSDSNIRDQIQQSNNSNQGLENNDETQDPEQIPVRDPIPAVYQSQVVQVLHIPPGQ